LKTNSQTNLLRKCGLLAHTSAAFLKNYCTEKLFVACGLHFTANLITDKCPLPMQSRQRAFALS
jgi:hypothetical protein